MAIASPTRAQVPEGFTVVNTAPGCTLYAKDYPGGQPDWVIVVDLGMAQVRSAFGPLADAGAGAGALGGDNPAFTKQGLQTFWTQAHADNSKTFAVLNGQFFVTTTNPSPLAFAVRADGTVVSDGYGTTIEYVGQQRLLKIGNLAAAASVGAFSKEALYSNDTPDAVAGLEVTADKSPATPTGRTFAAVRDDNGDGTAEQVLFFVSKLATQSGASDVLTAFGATEQVMLDGGGSSQLIVQGNIKVSSSRILPHAIVVIAEPAPVPAPILSMWTGTDVLDTLPEGPSAGVPDGVEEQELFVDVFVGAAASGGPTESPLTVQVSLTEPWLAGSNWSIATDWPAGDKLTWTSADADVDPKNPPKGALAAEATFQLGMLEAGETRRLRLHLHAMKYSLGEVSHAGVTATVDGGPSATQPLDIYGRAHWEWEGAEQQVEGWTVGGDVSSMTVDVDAGALTIKQAGADPWVASPETSFPAADYKGFKLRIRHKEGAKKGQLHWRTAADPEWSGEKATWFLASGDGTFQDVDVDTASNPTWKGTITGVRLDPSTGSTGTFEVAFVRATGQALVTTGDVDGDGWIVGEDCNDADPETHPAAADLCDGADNDCDGETDESFDVGTACVSGLGVCQKAGAIVCTLDGQAACSAAPGPPGEETCDGADNDCDGDTDEDFGLGEVCHKEVGACQTVGVLVCTDDGGAAICDAPEPNQSEEICNQQDDDCDGETDEGYELGEVCTKGIGPCATTGFVSCNDNGATYCKAPAPEVGAELCDAQDNDCDGETDEGFEVGSACTAYKGACEGPGTIVCAPTGLETHCEPIDDTCTEPGPGTDGTDPEDEDPPPTTAGGADGGGGATTFQGPGGTDEGGCRAAHSPATGALWAVLFGLVLLVLSRRRDELNR